jgi:hypothetical protein
MDELLIELKLSVKDVNHILGIIGKYPFEEVIGIINGIRLQAEPQVKAFQEAELEKAKQDQLEEAKEVAERQEAEEDFDE